MSSNSPNIRILKIFLLLIISTLVTRCSCKNHYVGQGEVNQVMIQDVEEGIKGYIQDHPKIDPNTVRDRFNPLLEALKKIQSGETPVITEHMINCAVALGKPGIIQTFIDIVSKNQQSQDQILLDKLNRNLEIAEGIAKLKNFLSFIFTIIMDEDQEEILIELEKLDSIIFDRDNKYAYQSNSEENIKKIEEGMERLIKHMEETARQVELEKKREKEKRKIEKEELKLKMKKLEEEWLQSMVERRVAVEKLGGIDYNTQRKFFFPDFSSFHLEYIAENIQNFRRFLQKEPADLTLSKKSRAKAKNIVAQIDKETKEITEALEGIHYSLDHPGDIRSISYYKPEHLQLANKLLEDLKTYKEELRQLLAARGGILADYEEEPEVETGEEKIAYRDLEESINDPSDTPELVAHSKQEMQTLLDKMAGSDSKRQELEQEAIQVATKIKEVLELIKTKERAIKHLYLDSNIEDYINRPINEGIQKIKMLQKETENLEESVDYFCGQFKIRVPYRPLAPAVTKEQLKQALPSLVDQLVPDSELIKATLQSRPLLQTPEAWANLGIEVGLDFIPYGKELKLLVGPDKPALQQKMKDIIAILLKKRASRTK